MGQADWWPGLRIYEDQDGQYYWHLRAAAGRVIACSGQAYKNKYWCVQDVNWLRGKADLIAVYDQTGESRQIPA